mgnify:FL=1
MPRLGTQFAGQEKVSRYVCAASTAKDTCLSCTDNPGPKVTMYFDGGCPLCTKEVSHYQKLDAPV